MPKAIELWCPNLSFTMISSTVYNFSPLLRDESSFLSLSIEEGKEEKSEKKGRASNLKHEESTKQKYWVLLKVNLKKLIKVLTQMWKVVRAAKFTFQHIMRSTKNQRFWFYNMCVCLCVCVFVCVCVNYS